MTVQFSRSAYILLTVLVLSVLAHGNANIYGDSCSKNSSVPDYNNNNICETILYTSSITTPKTGSSAISTRVYTSGKYTCPRTSTKSCELSTSTTIGGSKSDTISAQISGNAGQTSKISATVGFSSTSSYNWSMTHGVKVYSAPGTVYYYGIDATGTSYRGNYRAEFHEMNGGWRSVGYHTYGSWTAKRYTSNRQGWRKTY